MQLYKHSDIITDSSIPLSNGIYSKLQKDILTGTFKKGDKLTEHIICDEYEVSRTPVREALKQLEMDGLIEKIPNRGFFVVGISEQDFADLFDLRKVYEMQAAEWAVERITEKEMTALEETFEFMEFYTMKNDYPKMLEINNAFHRIIYKASHNRMLAQLLSLYQIYTRYIGSNTQKSENHLQIILEEHRKIYEAFVNNDKSMAVEAMKEHIEKSKLRHTVHE